MNVPPFKDQKTLLDTIAKLVDENLFGRSEMCIQFALLLSIALCRLGYDAKAYKGKASYLKPDTTWFEWEHSWVIYNDIIIDGNVDSMIENPTIPDGLDPSPYWGKLKDLPNDRKFDLENSKIIDSKIDSDLGIWIPDLERDLYEMKN